MIAQNSVVSARARELILKGNLYLSGATIKGYLDLSGATIKGDLDLSGATIKGYLDLSGATIKGDLDLSFGEGPKKIVVSPSLAECVHMAAPTIPLVAMKER